MRREPSGAHAIRPLVAQPTDGHGGVKPVVSSMIGDANIGAAYSRVAGMSHPVTGLPNSMFIIPKSIDAEQKTLSERFGKFDATGALGKAYTPFIPGGEGPLQDAMHLNFPRERFEDRKNLLRSLDGVRREFDRLTEMEGLTGLQTQATISHTLFDYGRARLIPDLPEDLRRGLARLETMPGVLGLR